MSNYDFVYITEMYTNSWSVKMHNEGLVFSGSKARCRAFEYLYKLSKEYNVEVFVGWHKPDIVGDGFLKDKYE